MIAAVRWVLVLGLVAIGGCGQSRLSPRASCETLIDSAVRCGTYMVGAFGGTSMEDDIDRCTANLALLNDRCQAIVSDAATCSTRACEDLASCSSISDRFMTECSGAP